MKKTSIFAVCMTLMTMLSACGSGNTAETETGNSSSDSAAVTEATEQKEESGAAETEAAEESSESESTEDIVSSIKDYKMHIPSVFQFANKAHKRIWRYKTDSDKTVFYSLICVPDYANAHPDETYTVDDAPEMLFDDILEDMRALTLPAGEVGSVCNVDTDEKKTMLGNDVIRRTGSMSIENYGETAELSYAAYYMVADMQNGDYKQVPVVWIAYSEDNSDETKAFMEEAVDLTFEKSEIAS